MIWPGDQHDREDAPGSGIDEGTPENQPPWMAGTIRISGAVASNCRIGSGLAGPVEPEGQPSRREMLGEQRFGRGDRLGPVLVPLGEGQVAVSRLEQSQLGHELRLLSLRMRHDRGRIRRFDRNGLGCCRIVPVAATTGQPTRRAVRACSGGSRFPASLTTARGPRPSPSSPPSAASVASCRTSP